MSEPSSVHSPAGIRLLAGLLGPFLTEDGQTELSRCWDTPIDDLFNESLRLATTLAEHGALHAALGVWVRDHTIPAGAREKMGHLLDTLPLSTSEAQSVLDGWANEHTNGMIPKFPCQVNDSTNAVLASAIAVDDTWARKADETRVAFKGETVDGFTATAETTGALSTADRKSVLVVLPLTSGLEMHFVASRHGLASATGLMASLGAFDRPVEDGQPFVHVWDIKRDTTDVAVRLPVFTTRSSLDLTEDPTRWGIATALQQGVPDLGDLLITDARQNAFIEVTHTGVRAAAVTAMMMSRSAASVGHRYPQRVVEFGDEFAYQIVLPGHPTPLFHGSYNG